ncbi:hypothetical protein P9112_009394 [Eukaryota sp. TZLM1-RC]
MIVENLPYHGPGPPIVFSTIIPYCSALSPPSLLTLLNVLPLITSSFETSIWRQISSLLTSFLFLVQFDLTINRCLHFSSHEKLAVAFKPLLELLRRPLSNGSRKFVICLLKNWLVVLEIKFSLFLLDVVAGSNYRMCDEKLAVAFKTLLEHLRRPLSNVNHVLFGCVLVVQCLFGVLTTSSGVVG